MYLRGVYRHRTRSELCVFGSNRMAAVVGVLMIDLRDCEVDDMGVMATGSESRGRR